MREYMKTLNKRLAALGIASGIFVANLVHAWPIGCDPYCSLAQRACAEDPRSATCSSAQLDCRYCIAGQDLP